MQLSRIQVLLLRNPIIIIIMISMAPEFFTGEPTGIKADVYSFGCIMEEIFSGVQLHSDQHFRGKSDV